MFSITVLAMGKLKEKFYLEAAKEYAMRLGAYCKFQLLELPEYRLPQNPSDAEIQAGLAREAAMLRGKMPKDCWKCVLTPEGTQLSSPALAEKLRQIKLRGISSACFLIGSSFGLDKSIKREADFQLSMSKMTFPHHLARIMVLEQLYRAETIQAGAKYHK